MFRGIFTLIIAFMISVLTFFYFEVKKEEEEEKIYTEGSKITLDSPPCLQMFYYIEKYSEEYEIPKQYAYGIAWKETGYLGPFDWDYYPGQESFAGAVGPMQVMPSTASFVWRKKIQRSDLKNDIELNVKTSMKYLRYLHNNHKNWKIVFGFYNTGRPIVNQYAVDVYNYNQN